MAAQKENFKHALILSSVQILLTESHITLPDDISRLDYDQLKKYAIALYYEHYVATSTPYIWKSFRPAFVGSSLAGDFLINPTNVLEKNKIFTAAYLQKDKTDDKRSLEYISNIQKGLFMENLIINDVLPLLYKDVHFKKPGRLIYDKLPSFACSTDVEIHPGKKPQEPKWLELDFSQKSSIETDVILGIIEIKTIVGRSIDKYTYWINNITKLSDKFILKMILKHIGKCWSNPDRKTSMVANTSTRCINPYKFLANYKREINVKKRSNLYKLIKSLGQTHIRQTIEDSIQEEIEIIIFNRPTDGVTNSHTVVKRLYVTTDDFPVCINPFYKDFIQIVDQAAIYKSTQTLKGRVDVDKNMSVTLLLAIPWNERIVSNTAPAIIIMIPICISDRMIRKYMHTKEQYLCSVSL
jgi:hypothetical protein